jgi:protoheme IX farnesyltransferase
MITDQVLATNVAVHSRSADHPAVLADYWALTKPDVNALVVMTTATGFFLGAAAESVHVQWIPLLHTMLGAMLVASGAAALNQWSEHQFDARMRRTARRPVAAGRIEPTNALTFGGVLSMAGAAYLAIVVSGLASLLALVTLLTYLLVYTPSKRFTWLSTTIGAVPGALPALIGWGAASGRLEPQAFVLFAIVFLWQFPHFMAIAWMYRDDYDRAGYRVLPRGATRTRFTIVQTSIPLILLLPVSLLPVLVGPAKDLYAMGALLMGVLFLDSGAQFALRRTGAAARQLLMVSIVYLPALLTLMMLSTLLAY